MKVKKAAKWEEKSSLVIILKDTEHINNFHLEEKLVQYVIQKGKDKQNFFEFNLLDRMVFVLISKEPNHNKRLEELRKHGHTISKRLNAFKYENVQLTCTAEIGKELLMACAEGIGLSNYQFLKYYRDQKERKNSLKELVLVSHDIQKRDCDELEIIIQSVWLARDWVNEPVSFLTAEQFSKELKNAAKDGGFNIEVFQKKKIEELKMGGLLGVNKGSIDPPTFNILEHKPAKPINKKPIVLVGKGVVYDTGGLSLKPTPNSMDEMKCDMAGGAAVGAILYAVAKLKLPVHIIGLIPATDNRPGGNAYAPGDVLKMYNGATVEVKNTDAEGRLILADALTYAQQYKPQLVVDFATLTGAAVRAIGTQAVVAMGTSDEQTMNDIVASGYETHERVVVMPFWDEYAEELKSDVADISNLGGPYAGQITAGKFLEFFTKNAEGEHAYPYVHIDIAGPAFMPSEDSYRGKWGTGVGVRLMINYLKKLA